MARIANPTSTRKPRWSPRFVLGAHACVAALAVAATSGTGYADWDAGTELLADDAAPRDAFGKAVAISGHAACIGAPDRDELGEASGVAYVCRLQGTTWEEEDKLVPSNGAAGDAFGYSVAISDDLVAVGAPWSDTQGSNSGSVYIFRHLGGTTWSQEALLLAPGGGAGDLFGFSVAIDGGTLIVGAYTADEQGTYSGAAYAFEENGGAWTYDAMILASDGEASDFFGVSVSLSGSRAMVGAYGDDDGGTNAGAVYIFNHMGGQWIEEAKLVASGGIAGDVFGWSVSISEDVAIAGAWKHPANGSHSGTAYIYRFDGTSWAEDQKLLPDDGAAYDRFGRSVSISGGSAVVGSERHDGAYEDTGAAYVFRYTGLEWIEETTLQATSPSPWEEFGGAVGISGNLIVVGASLVDEAGSNAGATYAYVGTPSTDDDNDGVINEFDNCPQHANPDQADCDGDGLGDVCAIAYGLSEDCNANGVPDDCDTAPRFDAESGPLAPIGVGSPQSLVIADASEAVTDVTMSFFSSADLGSASEYVDVNLNGTDIGRIFLEGATDCADPADEAEIVVPMATFNNAIASTNIAIIEMVASGGVSAGWCGGENFIEASITYRVLGNDANGNGVPDDCDGVTCLGDVDNTGTVDFADIMALLGAWGPCSGCIEDIDGNGAVGFEDILLVLSAWGTCE